MKNFLKVNFLIALTAIFSPVASALDSKVHPGAICQAMIGGQEGSSVFQSLNEPEPDIQICS